MSIVRPSSAAGWGETSAPVGHAAARSKLRRALALVASIALAVVCALLAIAAAGIAGGETSTLPPVIKGFAMIGALPMLGVCALIIWRHRFPVIVSVVATAATMVFPTSALAALAALAALTAVRRGWLRWVMIVATFAATVVALCWDLASTGSLVAGAFAGPKPGVADRLWLFWLAPVIAALCVAPFAAFGIGRQLLGERDAARRGSDAATRNVAVLHQEVQRERERQELARELHDTIAARLSTLSLHAGALELQVDQHPELASASARAIRASAQQSLDELRSVVRTLKNPAVAAATTGLTDIVDLVDSARRDGAVVHAVILLDAAATCDRDVAHACYRLVQESISNVKLHAPGAALYLDVRGDEATGLTIRATNWMVSGGQPRGTHGGNGLSGMGERVALVGGSFQAGPTAEGAFAVVAWMPWQRR